MRGTLGVAVVVAGLFLAGCERNPVDRLLGIDKPEKSDVTAPVQNTTPPSTPAQQPPSTSTPSATAPQFETYRFTGYVKSDGNEYPSGIAPNDPVTGTFRIDFGAPVYYGGNEFTVYQSMISIDGNVNGHPFTGSRNLVYVRANNPTAFWVDTGWMTLDGSAINFDFFFILASGGFPTSSMDNLRNLDRLSFSNVDLWFETNPAAGGGFNAKITTLQRADPITVASLP